MAVDMERLAQRVLKGYFFFFKKKEVEEEDGRMHVSILSGC